MPNYKSGRVKFKATQQDIVNLNGTKFKFVSIYRTNHNNKFLVNKLIIWYTIVFRKEQSECTVSFELIKMPSLSCKVLVIIC